MLVITKKRFLGPLIVTWFMASIYVIFVTTNDRINEVRVLNIEGINSDDFIDLIKLPKAVQQTDPRLIETIR